MGLLATWIVTAFALWLAAVLVPGVKVRGVGGALLISAVYGVASWLIGWLFFVAIGIATLGIGFLLAFVTRVVVSAIMLKLTDALTGSLEIRGFAPAVWTALLLAVVGSAAQALMG
jgi:putative membrane protein